MSLKCTSYCLNWSLILCQSLCPLFCGMFLLLTHKSTLGPWKPILRTNAFSSIPQLLSPSPSTLITQTGTATFPTILQTPTTTLCFTMLILWVVFTLGFQWTFWALLLLSGRHPLSCSDVFKLKTVASGMTSLFRLSLGARNFLYGSVSKFLLWKIFLYSWWLGVSCKNSM